jgi:hypothetical protein
MELIAAVLIAGPIGYFARTRKLGLRVYLAVWAVVFPVQTVVVYSMDDQGSILYWVFNAVILCVGIGLNRLGSVLRDRRRATVEAIR